MKDYMFFAIVFCVIAAITMFSGAVGGLKKTFQISASAQQETVDPIERQSQKAEDLKEKNRLMMERLQAKMDRMKK